MTKKQAIQEIEEIMYQSGFMQIEDIKRLIDTIKDKPKKTKLQKITLKNEKILILYNDTIIQVYKIVNEKGAGILLKSKTL